MIAEGIRLPGYRCEHRVLGFERRRNVDGGPLLTLAIAESARDGFTDWLRCGDVVTRMRLADLLSDRHAYPVNADRLYGRLGRGVAVGRKPKEPSPGFNATRACEDGGQ